MYSALYYGTLVALIAFVATGLHRRHRREMARAAMLLRSADRFREWEQRLGQPQKMAFPYVDTDRD